MTQTFKTYSFLLVIIFSLGACSSQEYANFFSMGYLDTNPFAKKEQPKEPEVAVLEETKVPLNIIDTTTNDVSLIKATQYNFGSNVTLYPLDEALPQDRPRIEKVNRGTTSYNTPNPNVIIFPLDGSDPRSSEPKPLTYDRDGVQSELLPMPERTPGTISSQEPRRLTGY